MISAFAAIYKPPIAYLHGYISAPSRQLLSQNQSLEDLERGKFSLEGARFMGEADALERGDEVRRGQPVAILECPANRSSASQAK
jgi:hypothetical protein